MCHAQEPLQPGIGEPPKGIVLDTPEAVRLNAREVYLAAAATDFMPPAGVADIPPLEAEDRGAIASWFNAGARGSERGGPTRRCPGAGGRARSPRRPPARG